MMFRKIFKIQHWGCNSQKLFMHSRITALITFALCLGINSSAVALEKSVTLQKGTKLPDVTMIGTIGDGVNLNTLKGKVTLLSIVPQLNTPVCDEQTHRFSEQNEGLDELITLVTMSTNTHIDQTKFSNEANIHNMTFFSDAPDFHFGRKTGLLLDDINILQRAVIVLDEKSTIRYVEIVPMSQLPNFEQAYRAARSLLAQTS